MSNCNEATMITMKKEKKKKSKAKLNNADIETPHTILARENC